VAVLFAREGADVAIGHLAEEDTDANETVKLVEAEGRRCLTLPGDIGEEGFCQDAVARVVRELGRLDVLVNNAAEQHTTESIAEITAEQLERTFRTNIFAMFYLTKAALPHLGEGSAIVNTTSVTAYQGNPSLLDYSSTKGAIVAFTRSLSQQLVGDGIRVNAVAPGPIWTPLIPATMPEEKVASFGKDVPMGRPVSRRRSRPATCSWPATTPRAWPGRCCIPTAATSSTGEVYPHNSSTSKRRGHSYAIKFDPRRPCLRPAGQQPPTACTSAPRLRQAGLDRGRGHRPGRGQPGAGLHQTRRRDGLPGGRWPCGPVTG
jgi:NAD(P)-dependent dehydrogenase (short-subunit alcohol dehydrogenase family)